MLRSPEQIAAREEVLRTKMRRLAPAAVEPTPAPAPAAAAPQVEEMITAGVLAKRWHVSPTTIRRWFRDEPGVVLWGRADSRPGKKRAHLSMRIPLSVIERVQRRLGRRV